MGNSGEKPVASRTTGRTAQKNNILAAKVVAETVRTTLGPKGMDKILVTGQNNVIITNDGATILNEMALEHPVARMLAEVARSQDAEVGDGTTTAVVLAGELLKNADDLLDKKIHPTVIAKGYQIAAAKAQELLQTLSQDIDPQNTQVLLNIATTAMTGKGAQVAKEHLSQIAVDAIRHVGNIQNIRIFKQTGLDPVDSDLIPGVIIDKGVMHTSMKDAQSNAKIALLSCGVVVRDTETDSKIHITDPSQLKAYLQEEESMLRAQVQMIIESGATAVFSLKGIDDVAAHYLSKAGIAAYRRVRQSDLESISAVTGAHIVDTIADLSSESLGIAQQIEQHVIAGNIITVIATQSSKIVTLRLCATTGHSVDEMERAVSDALGDLQSVLTIGKVVGGAGAIEAELSRCLRSFALSQTGRERLAVEAFAAAIDVIPRTLAENAGLDPIDVMSRLQYAHDQGQVWAGIDASDGSIMDAMAAGVVEPLKMKRQAISGASEVATMVLRIDDIILTAPLEDGKE